MVKEDIEIELISTEELIREAQKIKEAKRLAREANQVKRELTAGIAPISFGFDSSTGATPKAAFFGSEVQTRLAAITGARTDSAFKQWQSNQRQLERKIADLEKNQINMLEKMLGVQATPRGLMSIPTIIPVTPQQGLSKLFTFIGKWGIIGSLIVGAGSTILDIITSQFEPGGIWFRGIKVPRQVYTLNDVEESNAYRSGNKYITDDLRIVQRAPNSSNTANLKYEHIRYTMDSLGK